MNQPTRPPPPVNADIWTVAAIVMAIGLRVAMARGGLWLDEAWSSVMAHDAGGPLAVLSGIHHDNNHPLNSWWMQAVGQGAPPLVVRALAIGCSVATILPAARVGARRGLWQGRAAAWLFALSPMMVLLGSEARGYAPAMLALVVLIDRLDPARRDVPPSALFLVLVGTLGTLGHLVMLPGIMLVAGWLWLARRGWDDPRTSLPATLGAVRPALVASCGVVSVLFGWAWLVQGGMTIGHSTAFEWTGYGAALDEQVRLALGGDLLFPVAMALLVVPPLARRDDAMLWLVLGLGMPLAVLLTHAGNSQISRYYWPSGLALLWLMAMRTGALAGRSAALRLLAVLLLGTTLTAMIETDGLLVRGARGEPDLPVRIAGAQHPGPSRILLGATRLSAVVTLAAKQQGLPVSPVTNCAPADYLLYDLGDHPPPPTRPDCGLAWSLVDFREQPYLDGAGWALYRRAGLAPIGQVGLPAGGPVANGPRPAR